MRQKVELELERLERAGVIEPVQFSDWAAPIAPVVKTDGSIRICGDYKLTVNQVTKLDTYPLPRIEDLFASLSGGQAFTKLDLSNAYQQVSLDDASKAYIMINTSRGLFRYNCLPFGVASAPSIFQLTMETLLQGIPHVSVYLDDILVTGASEADHLRNYTIYYKPGKDHANADVLSRLPLPELPSEVPLPGEMILLMECLQTSTITAAQIRRWTERDPVLAKVRDYVMQGWPLIEGSVELLPYSRRRAELSVQDGCLLWGRRVVVLSPGRAQVIEVLHEGHPGTTRMKSLSRSYVWWPGLDAAVEECVRSCDQCQSCRKSPARAPLHPWEWLERPWARVHADCAGPFMGKMFLLLIDAHSKWMEDHIVASATSASTMEKMRVTFATHGLPETLVSDNGSVFTSAEFREFLKRNGIRHATSAPYHPTSNGLAECAVQVFKEGMRKATTGTLEKKVARFLLKYRITPHSTTGRTPAELLMARRLRSQLDQLHPDHSTSERVQLNQERQKGAQDGHTKHCRFQVGDDVSVHKFGGTTEWIPGKVLSQSGPLSFRIELEGGSVVRRYIDHMIMRSPTARPGASLDDGDTWDPTSPRPRPSTTPSSDPPEDTALRRSTRDRHPPTGSQCD